MCELLLRETTTLGMRVRKEDCVLVERDFQRVDTPWGEVRVKLGRVGAELINAQPEYEDCRRIAEVNGIPLKQVQEAAMLSFHSRQDAAVAAHSL
jgi:uncharacterized protein (DUF111 family)